MMTRFIKGFHLVALDLGKLCVFMRAPLTYVGEKNRKVTAVCYQPSELHLYVEFGQYNSFGV